MKWRSHGRLLAAVTAAWAVFWLAGLPRYYQQYPTRTMVWFDLLVLPPALWLLGRLLRRFAPSDRTTTTMSSITTVARFSQWRPWTRPVSWFISGRCRKCSRQDSGSATRLHQLMSSSD